MTPDGHVLGWPVEQQGAGHSMLLGVAADRWANLSRLGMAAGLDPDEWAQFAAVVRLRLEMELGELASEDHRCYPAPLRDLMVRLAQTRRFRARWTARIHQEWVNALLQKQPQLEPARIERTVQLINQAVPDCLITGHEHLIDELDLLDPDDGMSLQRRFVPGPKPS